MLGVELAAHYLASPTNQVFIVMPESFNRHEEEIRRSIVERASTICKSEDCMSRLHRITHNCKGPVIELPGYAGAVDVFWYLVEKNESGKAEQEMLKSLPGYVAKQFNYIAPVYHDDKINVREQAETHKIPYRIFRTSGVIGKGSSIHPGSGSLAEALKALHEIKSEITERLPEYFEYQALRWWSPEQAILNVIEAETAVKAIMEIAADEATVSREYWVRNVDSISFADLCDAISAAYEISVLPAVTREDLNAMDQAFHERIHGYERWFEVPGSEAATIVELTAEGITQAGWTDLFTAIREQQDVLRIVRDEKAAAILETFTAKTIDVDGEPLTYFVGGTSGPTVLILNALGQRLKYWYRLIEILATQYRVIAWEQRGMKNSGTPFRVSDQVNAMDSIIGHERIERCHLVGWCTGPKIAIEFYLRHPATVASMVFLNSLWKCDGSSKELDSAYVTDLESLCRMVDKKPAMARSVMKSIQPGGASDLTNLDEIESSELADLVISMPSTQLRAEVLAPFETEASTTLYARQLIDFWSCDSLAKLGHVNVPVLLISTQHDQISNPAAAREAAELLPQGKYVEVAGANHYCFYDRPEFIATLMNSFFRSTEQEEENNLELRAIA